MIFWCESTANKRNHWQGYWLSKCVILLIELFKMSLYLFCAQTIGVLVISLWLVKPHKLIKISVLWFILTLEHCFGPECVHKKSNTVRINITQRQVLIPKHAISENCSNMAANNIETGQKHANNSASSSKPLYTDVKLKVSATAILVIICHHTSVHNYSK